MNNQTGALKLSRLGLGCDRMSHADRKESIRTIHAALDAGVNMLNTADFYGSGHNEMLIGEAIKGYDRDKVFLSVKFGAMVEPNGRMYGLDVKPSHVKNYLAYSLKRLNVEYIDLYQPGRIDLGIPVEETISAIADMVKAGYVKNIGITQVDADTLRKANAVHPIRFVEANYSLFNRAIEKEIMPAAKELGIDVVAFGALAHGLLNGNYSKENMSAYHAMIPLYHKENIDQNLALIEAFREVATERHVTIPQLALAWLLAKGDHVVPLIGSTRVATLEDSLKALAITLSPDDLKKIEQAIPEKKIAGEGFINMKFKNGELVR